MTVSQRFPPSGAGAEAEYSILAAKNTCAGRRRIRTHRVNARRMESNMADRNVESDMLGVPKIDETLEILMLQAIDDAQNRLEVGADIIPSTSLIMGDKVLIETHVGTTEECFASAENTVTGARGAAAYAFCYDGYIDTDAGQKDAIICEGGIPGAEDGVALGLIYTVGEDGSYTFEEDVCYIAAAPNFLASAEPVDPIIPDTEDTEE